MARVLLANDDESMLAFLTKELERSGHDVVAVADGEEGLERLEEGGERAFDLLLTDIVMPGLDGIELSRRAIEIDPDLKIMFITGFAAVALAAGQAPDTRILSKLFHLRQLVDEVNRVMAFAAQEEGAS